MNHIQPFKSRTNQSLSLVQEKGWHLKRYAILADDRHYDDAIALSATKEAIKRLPQAGTLEDETGNHGIGFQIIHFAEVAVVAPIFYWQWGSVLSHGDQLRAPYEDPHNFQLGYNEIIGCVWELQIILYEIELWKQCLLSDDESIGQRSKHYLETHKEAEVVQRT